MKEKTVFFDLDDTLYDRSGPYLAAFRQFFGGRYEDKAAQAYQAVMHRGYEVFTAAHTGKISMDAMHIYRHQIGLLDLGIRITAAQALEQGRAVFAVPGPADVEQSRGCHALLRDGARLTETFADVLDELSPFGPLRRQTVRQGGDGEGREEAKETKRAAAELQMSGLELKLWEKLADGEADLDELIVSVDEEAGAVMACLLTMELRRLVRQLPGKRVARNDV